MRSLYQEHGFQTHNKAYHFFKNLYQYEQKTVLLISKHKLDAETGQHLPKNQKIFRYYDYLTGQTSYFYKTKEQLVGKVRKPYSNKKHFRLGTRSLNPASLLPLFSKHSQKEVYLARKPKQQLNQDFQTFLITRLLLLCKKAEFLHTPLEQEQVKKEAYRCSEDIQHHFQTKPVLHFTFSSQNTPLIRTLVEKLDHYATEFDMEESKEFISYPAGHDTKHQTILKLNGHCPCDPTKLRNQYLDN